MNASYYWMSILWSRPKSRDVLRCVAKKTVQKRYIRDMRSGGARKDSTLHNFTDTYNHLWDRSRPVIVQMERIIKRRPIKLKASTEIESMVESMFIEEEGQ